MTKLIKIFKSNQLKLIIFFLGCLILILSFVIFRSVHREKIINETLLIEAETIAYKNRINEEKLKKTLSEEKQMLLFEKIQAQKNIHVLIISDSEIGSHNRYQIKPSWQLEFEERFNLFTDTKINYDNMLLRGSNVLWAYMQVSVDLVERNYDLIILDFASTATVREVNSKLSSIESERYLEALIRKIYKKYPEVTIVMMESIEQNNQLQMKEDLAAKYNVSLITSHSSFDDVLDDLLIEEIQLKYTEFKDEPTIFKENRQQQLVSSKYNVENHSIFLDGIQKLSATLVPTDVKGFMLKNNLIVNYASTNYIEYTVNEPYVFVNYVTFIDGSIIDIYIDNQLYTSINSYSKATGVGVLMLPVDQGERLIRIEAKAEPLSKKYMMMHKLLVGE